jgi:PAS domain S-box-containing protein
MSDSPINIGEAVITGDNETRMTSLNPPAVVFEAAAGTPQVQEAARERMLDLLEHVAEGIFLLDQANRLIYINERGASLLRKPRSELLNRSLSECFPGTAGSPFQKVHERNQVEGVAISFEVFHPPFGVWFEVRACKSKEGLSVYFQDVTERKRMDETLQFLGSACNEPGGDFFQALARHLLECLSVDYVSVDRLQEGMLTAQTLVACHKGQFRRSLTYTLNETPCGEVLGRTFCCFPKDACRLFPKSKLLQELTAEGFAGVTIWSSQRQPIGMIVVISRQPLVNISLVESILQLVSMRAAVELERRQREQVRESHLASLNRLASISRDLAVVNNKQELLHKVADAAQQLVGARLAVCAHSSHDGLLQAQAMARNNQKPDFPSGELFPLTQGGALMEILQGRNTIRYAYDKLHESSTGWGLRPSPVALRGLLGARLFGREALSAGMILVGDKTDGEFTAEDEALLGQLAALCSVGLQQIEAMERADQREDLLARTFSSMTDGVMIYNVDGVMVDANRAAVEACGFNPINQSPEAISRKLLLRYLDGAPVPPEKLPSRRAIGDEVVPSERFSFVAPNGEQRVIVVSAAPLRARGQPTGAVVVWHDVTEQEELLRSLAESRDNLELRVQERTGDLQQAVQLLQSSEERYRTLFDSASLGIAVTSKAGRILDANPALCRMLGITLDEARSQFALKFYARPKDCRRLLQKAQRVGQAQEFETQLKRKDHGVFPAQLEVKCICLAGQSVLLTLVQDLTRRKQAEKRIQGTSNVLELFTTKPSCREYLNAAVKLLRDWCQCHCVGIRLLDANDDRTYAASLGFTRRFLKQEGSACMRGGVCACIQLLKGQGGEMNPADSKDSDGFFCSDVAELLKRLSINASLSESKLCVVQGYGSIAQVPIRFQGRLLGSIHLADFKPGRFTPEVIDFVESAAAVMGEALHRFDVEESLLESEERFRSRFEKHEAMMLLIDPASGVIIDANPAAALFYGRAREDLRKLSASDLGFAPLAPFTSRQPQGCTHSWKRFETLTQLGSSAGRTVEVHASPITMHQRTVLFAIMHNITERKLLERQIVEISEQERQRIGRDLHDSLGGHLTGLTLLTRALSQSLAEQGLPQAPLAAEIMEELNRGVAMTRAISHGLCPIEPGEQGLMDGLLEFALGTTRRTGVACRFRMQGSVSIPDTVVAAHLFRIVEEAVQNALRHAKPRRIEIRLRQNRLGLLLVVWNDGRALPASVPADKGLGLRTMRYRANLVGGDLDLRRAAGGGTVVTCLLPSSKQTRRPPSAVSINEKQDCVGQSAGTTQEGDGIQT